MHRERLERAEALLRNLPKVEHKGKVVEFDLALWFDPGWCGTTACAAGFIGLDPWFREQGFRTAKIMGNVLFDGERGFDACKQFFCIRRDQAHTLFWPHSYPPDQRRDPIAVADRIRALLDSKREAT